MKYLIPFLALLSGAMFLIGLIMLNLTWIVFLLILAANIFFDKGYSLFSLDTWSLFGTPIEFFIGGIILIAIARKIYVFAERLDFEYSFYIKDKNEKTDS